MNLERLSGPRRRQIAAEWARKFSELGEMLLVGHPCFARIVGPLVQGVVLERSSDSKKYRALSFVHFLGREFPTLSLQLRTVATRPNGSQIFLIVRDHPEGVESAAEAVCAQSPLPLSDVPTLTQVVTAYRRRVEAEFPSVSALPTAEELVLIPAACKEPRLVAEGVAVARRIAEKWPTERLPNADDWLATLEEQAADAKLLQETVTRELDRHVLGHLPQFDLI